MTRWAMVADLRRCVGCQTCTAACKHTNATLPLVQWRRVLDIETGEFPNVSRTFVPVGCMHCADPPCMHVCPSTATKQRDDGIVTIDYDLCIGCSYCAVACPYQARYKIDKLLFAYGESATRNEAAREDPKRLGVAQKCTFCVDRIDYGLEHGLTPGIDPEATPACVNSCIADALHFGDSDDPASNISTLLRENRHFRMHEELGTDPGFHYLWDGTREELNDATGAPDEEPLETDTDINMPGVAPWQQTHWDWRAAGNFILGGAGAGLYFDVAVVGALSDGAHLAAVPLTLAALGMISLGLFLVWMEIGRPWRFAHVIFHPQTSWMTREALVAGPLLALGLAALVFDWPLAAMASGVLALFFIYCQGRILHMAKGIPLWREPRIVPLIIATGLAEGCALFLIAGMMLPGLSGLLTLTAMAMLAFIAWRTFAWRRYRSALSASGAPGRALDALEGIAPWMSGLGAIVPAVLLAAGAMAPEWAVALYALAALSALAAGWLFKYTLVTTASYNQGFALHRTPSRGAGPTGPGIKPGWR
jgi:phenylacetyl-CoA:acceptor oxidoreductase subunit 1